MTSVGRCWMMWTRLISDGGETFGCDWSSFVLFTIMVHYLADKLYNGNAASTDPICMLPC